MHAGVAQTECLQTLHPVFTCSRLPACCTFARAPESGPEVGVPWQNLPGAVQRSHSWHSSHRKGVGDVSK